MRVRVVHLREVGAVQADLALAGGQLLAAGAGVVEGVQHVRVAGSGGRRHAT